MINLLDSPAYYSNYKSKPRKYDLNKVTLIFLMN